MSTVPVRYAGPQLRGVTLDDVRVRPGETIRVTPEMALRLLRQDVWEWPAPVDLEGMPDTVKGIKGWVGDDVDRARTVLIVELTAGEDARPSLVSHLEELLDDHDAAEAAAAAEAEAAADEDDQGEPDPEPPTTDPDAGDGEEA